MWHRRTSIALEVWRHFGQYNENEVAGVLEGTMATTDLDVLRAQWRLRIHWPNPEEDKNLAARSKDLAAGDKGGGWERKAAHPPKTLGAR